MNTIELYLISVTIAIVWFDILYVQSYIKKLLGYKEIDFIKPFDCRYCTFHHIGLITGLTYYLIQLDYEQALIYAVINYALTNIIIKLWAD